MKRGLSLLIFAMFSSHAADTAANGSHYKWGLASALRSATVPYTTVNKDPLLNSYVLLLYLDTPYLFLDGTEGGVRLYRDTNWQIAAYGAMHFVDLPRHDPNYFSDDTADIGLMASYTHEVWRSDLLLLSDPAWRTHAKLRLRKPFKAGNWQFEPSLELLWKSRDYNSYYYGMNIDQISEDIGADATLKSRWYIGDDIALLGEAKVSYLGYEVAKAPTIQSPVQSEIYVGAGLFQNADSHSGSFDPKGFLRFAVGEATPSSFTENISGQGARDLHGIYMISLFYGLPLSKSLFDTPIHTYLMPGFVHHFAREGYQEEAQEYDLDFKFYYRPQSWWLRFGFGTGLSYITDPTYIERYINEKDGYDHTSHLMQNLDITFDFELSRVFGKAWKDLWFGYGLHHRSGVFESAHQYGQIKGGSNYNTLYLQRHFEE